MNVVGAVVLFVFAVLILFVFGGFFVGRLYFKKTKKPLKSLLIGLSVALLPLYPFWLKMGVLYLRGQSEVQLDDVPLKEAETFWGVRFPQGAKVSYLPEGWFGKEPLSVTSTAPVAFGNLAITKMIAASPAAAGFRFPFVGRVWWNDVRLIAFNVDLARPVSLDGWACVRDASFLYDGKAWTFLGCHVERQVRDGRSFWDGQIFKKDEDHWQWEGYLTEAYDNRVNQCMIFDDALITAKDCNHP